MDVKLTHVSKVAPTVLRLLAQLIRNAPLFGTEMLPLLTAASAVGKLCGEVIPTIGTKSDPNSPATTTRATLERNPSRIFFVLKENMLNT